MDLTDKTERIRRLRSTQQDEGVKEAAVPFGVGSLGQVQPHIVFVSAQSIPTARATHSNRALSSLGEAGGKLGGGGGGKRRERTLYLVFALFRCLGALHAGFPDRADKEARDGADKGFGYQIYSPCPFKSHYPSEFSGGRHF